MLPSRLPLVRLGWLPTRREEAADEEFIVGMTDR